jgi:FKBP-type peptidyl-prolyl cis-trans isomerase 2
MPIKDGDKVKIDYTGTLEDGTVFDSSEKHGKPLEFQIGSKQVIKGFEEAIKGMEQGQEKDIKIVPEDGYGHPNPQLVQKVPREQLPKEPEPQIGMALAVKLPNGNQMPAKITEVTQKDITIDLNHPLAGKTLNFKIKAVEVDC